MHGLLKDPYLALKASGQIIAKRIINHFLGKFSLTERPKTEYVESPSYFKSLLKRSDEAIQVQYIYDSQRSPRNANVYIGIQVNSYARCLIYDHLISLKSHGAVI